MESHEQTSSATEDGASPGLVDGPAALPPLGDGEILTPQDTAPSLSALVQTALGHTAARRRSLQPSYATGQLPPQNDGEDGPRQEFGEIAEADISASAAKARVIEILGEKPAYAMDAPITRLFAASVAELCGDELPVPEVYVCRDDKPNARALPGYIIFNDGMYNLAEFKEEIDAVGAHELEHIKKGHSQSHKAEGVLEEIGEQRVFETEADIGGMIRMDNRGINPRGMPSIFEKMQRYLENREDREGPTHLYASPTHGQSANRAVNIDQSFLLYDARSLEHGPLTPLEPLPPEDRGALAEDFETHIDDSILAQAILERRFRTFTEELEETLPVLLDRQARLLVRHTGITEAEAKRLAPTAAMKYNAGLAKRFLGDKLTLGTITALVTGTEHEALQEQCGSYRYDDYNNLAATLLTMTLEDSQFESTDRQQVVSLLRDKTGDEEFCRDGIESYVEHAKTVTSADTDKLIDIAAVSNLSIEFGDDLFHNRTSMQDRFVRKVATNRLKTLVGLQNGGDVVGVLEFASRIRSLEGFIRRHEVDEDESQDLGLEYEAYMLDADATREHIDERAYDEGINRTNLLTQGTLWEYVSGLLASADIGELVDQINQAELDDKTRRRIAIFVLDAESYAINHNAVQRGWAEELKLLPLYVASGNKKQLRQLVDATILQVASDLYRQQGDESPDAILHDIEARLGMFHGDLFQDEETIDITRFSTPIDDEDDPISVTATYFRGVRDAWLALVQRSSLGAEEINALLKSSDIVRDHFLLAGLEQLHHTGDPGDLITLMTEVGLTRIRGGGAFGDEIKAEIAQDYWRKSVTSLLEKTDLLETEDNLLALVALGMSAESIEVNLHTPAEAMRHLIQEMTFDEGLELVFGRLAHLPAHVMRSAVEELMESKARSLEDFDKLDKYMMRYVTNFIDEEQAAIGVGSILETNLLDAYKALRYSERTSGAKHDTVAGLESVKLIRAMLSTAQNDQAIREYVFDRWWLTNRTNLRDTNTESYFKVEDILTWRYPGKELRLGYWLSELPPEGTYHPVEDILNNLYLSNPAARYLAVRSILLGERGVLDDREGRLGLVDGLMNTWLNFEEGSTGQQVLQNLLTSFMDSTTSRDIYKLIGPILQDLILRPPNESANNEVIARTQAEKTIASLHERRQLSNPTEQDIANVAKKILNLMRGRAVQEKQDQSAAATNQLLSLFGEPEAYEFKQMSGTELALMAGKKAGALGVRMLQLAGQYYEIPEEERDSFNEVYDSMVGQTRMQAYRILKREAEYSEAIADLLENIVSIDERLGGGSLVTVYGLTLRDGSKDIIGVRNPNAEYHVVQFANVIMQTLDLALERDPGNQDLLLARSLVEDAVTWIRDELNDTEFTAKDTVFRAENDTQTDTGFKKGRSKYELYVPQATPTDSLWLRHETRVPGVNLNNLRVVEDGPTNLTERQISRSDYQDAISLLVRDYLHQLNEGSFLHSDIHPGNFRVTKNNEQLAVFDRHNLIPVTPELRTTLQQSIRAIASGDMRGAIAAIVQGADTDRTLDTTALTDHITSIVQQTDDVANSMVQTIVELKKAGVHIPIHLSLVLRNIFGLSRITERAGFSNLFEAFTHTADEEEILRTMTHFTDLPS